MVWSTFRPIECSTSATRMPSDESARLSTSRTLSGPVAELLATSRKRRMFLIARDLERQHREDRVRHVEDREGRVVEAEDMQSTTISSRSLRRPVRSSAWRLTGLMSSASPARAGRRSTRMPAEWLITKVSRDSASPLLELGSRSAIDLFAG